MTTTPASSTAPASPSRTSTRSAGRLGRTLRRIAVVLLLIVVIVAGALLAIDNQTPVSLRFLHYVSRPWPVSWWLALAFGSGVIIGLAACLGSLARARWRIRRLQRTLDEP